MLCQMFPDQILHLETTMKDLQMSIKFPGTVSRKYANKEHYLLSFNPFLR